MPNGGRRRVLELLKARFEVRQSPICTRGGPTSVKSTHNAQLVRSKAFFISLLEKTGEVLRLRVMGPCKGRVVDAITRAQAARIKGLVRKVDAGVLVTRALDRIRLIEVGRAISKVFATPPDHNLAARIPLRGTEARLICQVCTVASIGVAAAFRIIIPKEKAPSSSLLETQHIRRTVEERIL